MADIIQTENPPHIIEAPAPTAMPMLAAAGITLAFAGLVTSFLVTVVGLVLAVVGFTGWFREVLPREHREKITG